MVMEYEKPFVTIISFEALEQLATDGDRTRAVENGDEGITIPSMPDFSEGVEDW